MSDILKEEEEFFNEYLEEDFGEEHAVFYKELDPDLFGTPDPEAVATWKDGLPEENVFTDGYRQKRERWVESTKFDRIDDIKGYKANTVAEVNKEFNSDLNPYKVPSLYVKTRGAVQYTPAQKVAAAQGWLASGSLVDAARVAGLDVKTIKYWKYNAEWWPEVIRRLKVHQLDSVESMLNVVVHKSLGQIMDRLEHGDEVLDKEGNRDYVKVKAKDLASIVAQMNTAKKNMTEDQEDNTKEVNTLSMLEEKLRSIAKAELGKTVVSDQPKEG